MADGFSIVCPTCGEARNVSEGFEPNEDGQLICAGCGAIIPIPLAAQDEPISDSTTYFADPPTVIDPHQQVSAVDEDSVESLLPDSHYIPQETIGKGGMGEIVLCVEQNTRRQVAMKRMLPTTARHPRQRARFVEEAQVTAQLEHPNIVPVHELGRDAQGSIYFTMKLVKGRSLGEILTGLREGEESHSLVELLQVFLKVCDGVAFAHSRGVIHRDLKPGNIMVGDFGEVLVMDWGIARILSRGHSVDETSVSSDRHETEMPGLHTTAGAAMGSPSYMPPEQAAGQIERIDHRSDIYALGAILYAILTLQRPVTGKTAESIMNKVVRGDISPPEKRTPDRDIPRELSAVAMKCLSKYRRGRYASVPELQRDISLYLEGRSVSAAPDSSAQALVKLIKRNKPVSISIAAAAALLLAVASVAFISIRDERDSALASERKAVTAQQHQRATALAASKRFAMQAIRAAETGRTEEAQRRLTDAETVALNSPWGSYARGMLARTVNDYAAAADLFRKALAIDPNHAKSKAALAETLLKTGDLDQAGRLLSSAGDAKDWRVLLNAGQTLYDAGRWAESQAMFKRAITLMEQAKDAATGVRLATAKEVQDKIDQAQKIIDLARAKSACAGFADELKGLSADQQIQRVKAKLEEVNGVGMQPWRASIKDGKWIGATLPHNIRFLEPLRGLQLQHLDASWNKVEDIEPLRGMPLMRLACNNTRVKDLAPLVESMTLTSLNCYGTFVSSLEPLKGMPLKELDFGGTAVTDLSPAKGMPLVQLQFQGAKISDLNPIRDMRLVKLKCNMSAVVDLSPLAGMQLTDLNVSRTKVYDLGPLKGMPLETLDISSTRVADLSVLKGMGLKRLLCSFGEISDLDPIKGMQLDELSCARSKVSDLTVLKGMPLIRLDCHETKVSDLRPIAGAPLKELMIHDAKITDLTPLAGMRLTTLTFTPSDIKKGIEVVREMKTIEWLGIKSHYNSKKYKPVEFWNRYDDGEFK